MRHKYAMMLCLMLCYGRVVAITLKSLSREWPITIVEGAMRRFSTTCTSSRLVVTYSM